MTHPLWTVDEIVRACGGIATVAGPSALGEIEIGGVSIDSRSISDGDLFVALCDKRDGHDFVPAAFQNGAAAALVRLDYQARDGDGLLIRVGDPLEALRAIAIEARRRLAETARVIAVTGSVGKTGTKEMLRACLSRLGKTHAADKSFNNHWGVPLTLARMARDTEFAVVEIGMNHAGEITPLTKMTRPHIAIVTTVAPVHLEFFESVEGIAEAKAEIFLGLVAGGVAVLNRDNAYFELLKSRALESGGRIVSFGEHEDADVHLAGLEAGENGSSVKADRGGAQFSYQVGIAGAHSAMNSLVVVAVLAEVTERVAEGLQALGDVRATAGRGARLDVAVEGGRILVTDESYNANPASMRAALSALGQVSRQAFPRRVAVLGDMLELGPAAGDLHRGLCEAIALAGIDKVFCAGPQMALLFEALPAGQKGAWAETSAGLHSPLNDYLRAGDAVMVKGSLGSNMAPLVEAIAAKGVRQEPA